MNYSEPFLSSDKTDRSLESKMIKMMRIKQAGMLNPLLDRKSKFIASASPISSEEEARSFILKVSVNHRKATHNAYGYRIKTPMGIVASSGDDGEVKGCAGDSILYVLEKKNVVNSIIVVSRYYGGVKLGKGGLVKNYSRAAVNAINMIGLDSLEDKQ